MEKPMKRKSAVAASPRSAGKRYEDAVAGRWAMDTPIPEQARERIRYNKNTVEIRGTRGTAPQYLLPI